MLAAPVTSRLPPVSHAYRFRVIPIFRRRAVALRPSRLFFLFHRTPQGASLSMAAEVGTPPLSVATSIDEC